MKHPTPWTLDPVCGIMDAHCHLVTEAEAVEFVNSLTVQIAMAEGSLKRLREAGWAIGDDGDPYQPEDV